jgi:hypothetical protein
MADFAHFELEDVLVPQQDRAFHPHPTRLFYCRETQVVFWALCEVPAWGPGPGYPSSDAEHRLVSRLKRGLDLFRTSIGDKALRTLYHSEGIKCPVREGIGYSGDSDVVERDQDALFGEATRVLCKIHTPASDETWVTMLWKHHFDATPEGRSLLSKEQRKAGLEKETKRERELRHRVGYPFRFDRPVWTPSSVLGAVEHLLCKELYAQLKLNPDDFVESVRVENFSDDGTLVLQVHLQNEIRNLELRRFRGWHYPDMKSPTALPQEFHSTVALASDWVQVPHDSSTPRIEDYLPKASCTRVVARAVSLNRDDARWVKIPYLVHRVKFPPLLKSGWTEQLPDDVFPLDLLFVDDVFAQTDRERLTFVPHSVVRLRDMQVCRASSLNCSHGF